MRQQGGLHAVIRLTLDTLDTLPLHAPRSKRPLTKRGDIAREGHARRRRAEGAPWVMAVRGKGPGGAQRGRGARPSRQPEAIAALVRRVPEGAQGPMARREHRRRRLGAPREDPPAHRPPASPPGWPRGGASLPLRRRSGAPRSPFPGAAGPPGHQGPAETTATCPAPCAPLCTAARLGHQGPVVDMPGTWRGRGAMAPGGVGQLVFHRLGDGLLAPGGEEGDSLFKKMALTRLNLSHNL